MDRPRSRPGGNRADRQSHHISAIAHHFLPNSGEDNPEAGLPILELAIASSNNTPAGAFAAAGVLAGFYSLRSGEGRAGNEEGLEPAPDLYLHETTDPRWSAISYLDSSLCRVCDPPGYGSFISPGLGSSGSWRVGGKEETRPRSSGGDIHVHQLGEVSGALLEWADRRRSMDPRPVPRVGVRTGLVWCIPDREADSLSQANALGRLMASLNPDCLEVLVFPDSWPGNVRSGWLGRIQTAALRGKALSRPDPAKIERMVACLQPAGGVRVTLLDVTGDGKMAAGCSATMQEVARGLTSF